MLRLFPTSETYIYRLVLTRLDLAIIQSVGEPSIRLAAPHPETDQTCLLTTPRPKQLKQEQ